MAQVPKRWQQPALVLLVLALVGAGYGLAAAGVPFWAVLVGAAVLGSVGGAIYGAQRRRT